MMQSLNVAIWLGLFAMQNGAMAAFLGVNASHMRAHCANNPHKTSYGKNACRCIGIDNLQGYYATQVNFHHTQYTAETGASCGAWDKGSHPECKGAVPPQWCSQQWCYVDPCDCDLDVLPKITTVGIKYQGRHAYYSYDTCSAMDFFSEGDGDACVKQKSQGDCEQNAKCAWYGSRCGASALGAGIAKTCKEEKKKDEGEHGQEDCRCIGLGGKDIGKAFMHVNDKDVATYSPNVGATCQAWEMDSHPDCLKKDGEKPSWCASKWCFVDPCKCKTKVPPKTVMPANEAMRFQGKTAYWSYETCGSADTWSSSQGGEYCVTQKSEEACSKLSKCAWSGESCLGKALVEICAKQEESGVLGVEAPLPSSTISLGLSKALLVTLVAFATAQA